MRKTIAIVLLAVLICSLSVSALSFSRFAKKDVAPSVYTGNLAQKLFSDRFRDVVGPRLGVSSERLKCVKEVTPETFDAEVLRSELPVAVDFWAPWCHWCTLMKPVFEQACREYRGRMNFVAYNTDLDEGVWERYGISGIPAILFFNDGSEVYRQPGYLSIDRFRGVINSVLRSL